MRCYQCECLNCHQHSQLTFEEPYPEIGDEFPRDCKHCGTETIFTRVLTKKALAEMARDRAEEKLKQAIIDYSRQYGFKCRFLFESIIITTPIAEWSFGYHEKLKTLYHENTIKINLETGDFARMHRQFTNRKMSCFEVIDYIAAHDQWRQHQQSSSTSNSTSIRD